MTRVNLSREFLGGNLRPDARTLTAIRRWMAKIAADLQD